MPKYTAIVQLPAMRIGNLEAANDAEAEVLLKKYMVRENLPNMLQQMLDAQYRATITRELDPFVLARAVPEEEPAGEDIVEPLPDEAEQVYEKRPETE